MKLSTITCFICPLLLVSVMSAAQASTYAGQETRDIKAMSPDDVTAYLSGKGIGLAKAAELNGYAGPSHVLQLASQLNLTPDQRAKTEALFASMESKATLLGEKLVAEERRLDRLFATKAITPQLMSSSLSEIGSLQAKVRGAHLEAHLAQIEILTPAQNAKYAQLRGYTGSDTPSGHGVHH